MGKVYWAQKQIARSKKRGEELAAEPALGLEVTLCSGSSAHKKEILRKTPDATELLNGENRVFVHSGAKAMAEIKKLEGREAQEKIVRGCQKRAKNSHRQSKNRRQF